MDDSSIDSKTELLKRARHDRRLMRDKQEHEGGKRGEKGKKS
jgi:hypothetical protein